MTDAVVHTDIAVCPTNSAASATSRCRRFVAILGRWLYGPTIARRTRRALDQLPDDLLADIGLTRSDIPFVADALASGFSDPTRDVPDRPTRTAADRAVAPRWLPHVVLRLTLLVVLAAATFALPSRTALAQDAQIKRGKYLVTLGGCNDCHTPGYFFGKPDMARFLGGSEVGFEIPGLGVFHGPNLTPDQDTGLGKWSTEEIVTAITKGQRPDGRILAPIMPWHAYASLTREDARAMAAFLKSLPRSRTRFRVPLARARRRPPS